MPARGPSASRPSLSGQPARLSTVPRIKPVPGHWFSGTTGRLRGRDGPDDDEAVELANATSFGLGGTVYSSDLQRVRSVADRVDSGMVWINQPTSTQADLPFGGVKRSGFGRELSQLGMYGFTNRKLVRTFPAAAS